jgi:hypothetical protein
MVIFCGITSKICAICFFDTQIVSALTSAFNSTAPFKVKNEGNEIHCHLSENLSVDDYKSNYLGEWVEITGKISQAGDIIKEIEIEIEKLKKITKLGQINIA